MAAALAVTLAAAGTAGAVAGSLVTSKNIKDHTIKSRDLDTNSVRARNIAPGSVTWSKSLSAATRAQIEDLLGEGVPGPAGSTGPQGPRGPQGNDGEQGVAGPAGSGELVEHDVFVPPTTPPESEDGTYELEPVSGGSIELTEPGTYLVTIQGATVDPAEDSFISLGQVSAEDGSILDGCFAGDALEMSPPLAMCSTTYTIGVGAGAPRSLPVYATTVNCLDDFCMAPAFAKVAIYKMSSAVATEPTLPHCRTLARPASARC